MDLFFDSCLDEVGRSSTSPSSTTTLRPFHNHHAQTATYHKRTRIGMVSFSSLSIRRSGRQPKGPVDR
jgi:hypothetical protein